MLCLEKYTTFRVFEWVPYCACIPHIFAAPSVRVNACRGVTLPPRPDPPTRPTPLDAPPARRNP